MSSQEEGQDAGTGKALAPWTPLHSKSYFLAVPEFFLDHYAKQFGLTAGEAMLVLHMLRRRSANGYTCLKIQDLADQMGMSYGQIRNYIASLEKAGYLRRTRPKQGQPCWYDLGPLCEELEKHRASLEKEQLARTRKRLRYLRA